MSDAQDKDLQTFNELQRKFIEHTEKQKIAQQQLHTAQQARRRSDLTVRELSGLSDDIPAYRAIGKAYFLRPRQELVSELESQAADSLAEANALKDSQASLHQSLKGVEAEMQELLHSSQRLASAVAANSS